MANLLILRQSTFAGLQHYLCRKTDNQFLMRSPLSLLISCLAVVMLTSCAIQPVAFKNADNLKLDLDFKNPSVTFDLNIYNPNSFGVTLSSVQSIVSVDGKKVSSISAERSTHIPPRSDVAIPLRAQPSMTDIAQFVMAGVKAKELRTEGTVTIRKFIFSRKVPFSVKSNF